MPPTRRTRLQRLLFTPTLMKIPEEIIKEPILRALVALEGKQGSNLFNSRLHSD